MLIEVESSTCHPSLAKPMISGLRYLYLASYVHRDMSSGNILLCSGNRGKISYLEFAKVFQSDAPESDPKTVCLCYEMCVDILLS